MVQACALIFAATYIHQILSRIIDAVLAIPVLIYALMLLAIFGKGILNLIAILAVLDW